MKFSIILPALTVSAFLAAGCASVASESLEDVAARAEAACPAAIDRSNDAGDYSYSLSTCECIAGRITTPLWSDTDSAYSGDPMPLKDAKVIANAIAKGETLKLGMEDAKTKISVPSANSVNTCFSK